MSSFFSPLSVLFKPIVKVRCALAYYVDPCKPRPLDISSLKTTFSVSPFEPVYFHCVIEPSLPFSKTLTTVSVHIEKSFKYGTVQLQLFRRTYNKEASISPMQSSPLQLRQKVSLPLHTSRRVDLCMNQQYICTSMTLGQYEKSYRNHTSVDPLPVKNALARQLYVQSVTYGHILLYLWLAISNLLFFWQRLRGRQ